MAFSSLYAFAVDPTTPRLKRSDAAMKTYETADDARSWSIDAFERSKFIEDIVKGKRGESVCEGGGQGTSSSSAGANFDGMSSEDLKKKLQELLQEMKAKDVELDKIHKLFKHTSKKLEDMNDVIKENRQITAKLKDSEIKLAKLNDEKRRKEESAKSMQQELDDLKCNNSTASVDVDRAWEEIKSRANLLDGVVKERNALKEQLCKMIGISEVLRQLKERADQADCMEQEIEKLKRELQRNGASGDAQSKKRPDSGCKHCHKFCDDLERTQCMLQCEIDKNVQTEAERNFLRERVRALDITEAELIFYKMKLEECECQLKRSTELLLRCEMNDKTVVDLKDQLDTTEGYLHESERHSGELLNIIEKQDLDLKERDIYIDNVTRRGQTEGENDTTKKTPAIECKPGKVQSIVRQLSNVAPPSNCKCGFGNCECAKVTKSCSNVSKTCANNLQASSADSVHDPSKEVTNNLEMPCSINTMVGDQDDAECSLNEMRLLRQRNRELDCELQRYKAEVEQMTTLMTQVEQQRSSNCNLEKEVSNLNTQCRELETISSSIRSSMTGKDNELEDLQCRLKEQKEKCKCLEQKLLATVAEVTELRPLKCLQERCDLLENKLQSVESDGALQKQNSDELQECCVNYRKEICELKIKIDEFEIEVDEQRKYAQSLAQQLQNRQRCGNEKGQPDDNKENRELLIKCIKDIKKRYDALKREKVDLIQCYEKKLKALESDNNYLRCNLSSTDGDGSNSCKDAVICKMYQHGFPALNSDDLIILHQKVRDAMMRIKTFSGLEKPSVPSDYYTKIADELRLKHKISDELPWKSTSYDCPVKDVDACSSKTLPSIMKTSRKAHKHSNNKIRARSSESQVKMSPKSEKCVKISRKSHKN